MKKFTFLVALPLIFLLPGCGDKEVDITDTDIKIDVCNEYFELAECIIDKTKNETWTPEMKNELRKEIKMKQDEWSELSESAAAEQCSYILNKLKDTADLSEIWCSVK